MLLKQQHFACGAGSAQHRFGVRSHLINTPHRVYEIASKKVHLSSGAGVDVPRQNRKPQNMPKPARNHKTEIIVAVIGAAAVITAALVGIFKPEQRATGNAGQTNSSPGASVRKKVTFRLESFFIHNDGDSGLEGQGDFVWSFVVNGIPLDSESNERNFGGGHREPRGKQVVLELDQGTGIHFAGNITDKDGGASGADDNIVYDLTFQPNEVYNRSSSLRPAAGDDPDVEVFYSIIVE
jgi:hypothetical protein